MLRGLLHFKHSLCFQMNVFRWVFDPAFSSCTCHMVLREANTRMGHKYYFQAYGNTPFE